MGRAFGNTAAQIRSVTPRLPNRRQRIVKETAMLRAATPERLSAFSDGVFAVLITVLVLDLRPPELPAFKALLLRWPTWLSYAVSYLFIAIVWANHHHLIHVLERGNGGSRTARCTGGCGNPCETRSRVSRRQRTTRPRQSGDGALRGRR